MTIKQYVLDALSKFLVKLKSEYFTPWGGRIQALEDANTWETLTSSITFTAGTNCSSVTLQNAYKIGKLLFIKFAVTPVSGLASGANVDVTVSGIPTPKIINDYRIGLGVIGTGLYSAWFSSATNIRCRLMAASAWTASGVVFTGIIPLA